jgi:TonB-linked SusC/RagA family outer membrane protein
MKHKQLSFVSIRCRVYAKAITSLAFASVAILATAKPVATESTSVQTIMQTKITVQGVVKDAHGDPIVGATVTEKGNSKNGTITDIDGHYSISLPRGKMVDVTYVGFKTLSFTASSTKHDIVLEEDLTDLNEVVVIGYGTQKKADVTSSVASVKAKDFNTGSVIDAGQLVQGKVAGLSISLPSGDPNGSTTVMLRGTSSLMGSSTPLVLVDGVPGSLSTVAPEEIESIDVLKDGSATAIYGTRGTNGVIIITTKSGSRESAPSIEYNGYLSTSYQAKKADFLNADELRSRLAEGWSPSGADDKDYGASVDWLKEVSRTALSHNHDLTFRGGSKTVSYIASLNYQNRQGTLKKTNGKNIRANLELTHRMFNDKLTTTIMLIASELKYPYGVSNGTVYRDACIQNPTQPIYDENGKYVERNVYFYDNPVSLQNENIGSARNRNIRFTGTMVYRPFEDLMLKGSVTRKGQNSMNGYYQTKEHPSTTENGLNGYAYRYSSDYIYNNVELTADWHHQFGKNNIEAIAGYSYEDNPWNISRHTHQSMHPSHLLPSLPC